MSNMKNLKYYFENIISSWMVGNHYQCWRLFKDMSRDLKISFLLEIKEDMHDEISDKDKTKLLVYILSNIYKS